MSCCGPGGEGDLERGPRPPADAGTPGNEHAGAERADQQRRPEGSAPPDRVELAGGRFTMGTAGEVSYPEDGETVIHTVELARFAIDVYAVSNDRFARFADATGFVTDAERYGWSFVFGGLLPDDFVDTRGVANAPWWRQVFGADWRHPEGPHSNLDGRGDHPVIHISHDDALAFCAWDGSRLPTEAEWEYAARGGLDGRTFPWGDELEPDCTHRMNVWQGQFPNANTAADGYVGPAPVDSFEPNGFGLHNVCGNVWEWCSDWFAADYYHHSPTTDPTGPTDGQQRVMRGGSYLCHDSYCHRYRVGARSSSGPDSSAGNLGFRTVAA